MEKSNSPLKVALHAMDSRTIKTMIMFLKGPCKNTAIVVNEPSAEVDIFDADTIHAKTLLEDYFAKSIHRPVIVLSLRDVELPNVIAVKKPVQVQQMIHALDQARARLVPKQKVQTTALKDKSGQGPRAIKQYTVNLDEQKKTAKHQAAMQLSEAAFNAYIGNIPGVHVNDPKQFASAGYCPKDYFQTIIQSAVDSSLKTGRPIKIVNGWKPLYLFPDRRKVWLDADDKQLRSFAGLRLAENGILGIKVVPVDPNLIELPGGFEKDSGFDPYSWQRYQDFDAFCWKLACWASKGRYPNTLDFDVPVYLKHWPNFTRLLITPHAMRIAALLARGPRTMLNAAEVLAIKPQYVFIFVSAAAALGLVGQAIRESDGLEAPSELKPSSQKSILGRIISKLRGNRG